MGAGPGARRRAGRGGSGSRRAVSRLPDMRALGDASSSPRPQRGARPGPDRPGAAGARPGAAAGALPAESRYRPPRGPSKGGPRPPLCMAGSGAVGPRAGPPSGPPRVAVRAPRLGTPLGTCRIVCPPSWGLVPRCSDPALSSLEPPTPDPARRPWAVGGALGCAPRVPQRPRFLPSCHFAIPRLSPQVITDGSHLDLAEGKCEGQPPPHRLCVHSAVCTVRGSLMPPPRPRGPPETDVGPPHPGRQRGPETL